MSFFFLNEHLKFFPFDKARGEHFIPFWWKLWHSPRWFFFPQGSRLGDVRCVKKSFEYALGPFFLQKHDKTLKIASFLVGIVSSWFPFWPGVTFSITQNLMQFFWQFVRTTPAGHREWTCLLLGFLGLGSAWRPWIFSRKRPRRVPSKKALPWKTVIKDCHQTSPKVLLKWWLSLKIVIKHRPKFCWSDGCLSKLSSKALAWKTVIKDCHQTSPKVLLKWWLSLKIVIKHRPKFCWSDGCLSRLSSKAAQSSTEAMAVLKDCHQRLPKVLLKWWLSLKIVIKGCPKFCWSDGCP